MTTVPFALSVHSLVSSAGADAGFAAIIGLAILVLLYFAQARETSTLRDRLDEAGQRVEYLEARLGQLHRAQAAQAAADAPGAARPGVAPRPGQPTISPRPGRLGGVPPAGAEITAARGRGGLLPSAPAGMAAPALAAATRLIPLPTPAAAPAAAASVTAPVSPGVETEADEQTEIRRPSPVASGVAAAPAQQNGDDTGEDTILVAPATAAAAAANGRSQAAAGAPSSAPAPVPSRSPAGPPRTAAAPPRQFLPGGRPPASRQPSLARRLVPILVGLAIVAVVIVALLVITRNPSTSARVHRSAHVTARSKHKAAAVNPATVTVAVLNGTGVTNLAHDIASRLATSGYKEGTIATAADQTHNTTIVAYLPGHRGDARAVAGALGLSSSAVQSVNQQAMGVACPGSTSSSTCAADVVVTVGSDLSSAASNPSG